MEKMAESLSQTLRNHVNAMMARVMYRRDDEDLLESWVMYEMTSDAMLDSYAGCNGLIELTQEALKKYDHENWISKACLKNLIRILKTHQTSLTKTGEDWKLLKEEFHEEAQRRADKFYLDSAYESILERLNRFGSTVMGYHMYETLGAQKIKEDLAERGVKNTRIEVTNYNVTKDCFEDKAVVNGHSMWVLTPILPIVKISTC